MRDQCCDQIVGGRVYITAGDKRWEADGAVTLDLSNEERSIGATSSGRLTSTIAAKPFMATFSLFNFCDSDPVDLWKMRCKLDISIVEKDRGFIHLLSGSIVGGAPQLDMAAGVVSGMTIGTDNYERVDR